MVFMSMIIFGKKINLKVVLFFVMPVLPNEMVPQGTMEDLVYEIGGDPISLKF